MTFGVLQKIAPNVKHWRSSGLVFRLPGGNADLLYKYEANENL